MKKKIIIGTLVIGSLFSLSLVGTTSYAQSGTKACRLTIVSEDKAITECISEGVMCSSVTACFRIFNPEQ